MQDTNNPIHVSVVGLKTLKFRWKDKDQNENKTLSIPQARPYDTGDERESFLDSTQSLTDDTDNEQTQSKSAKHNKPEYMKSDETQIGAVPIDDTDEKTKINSAENEETSLKSVTSAGHEDTEPKSVINNDGTGLKYVNDQTDSMNMMDRDQTELKTSGSDEPGLESVTNVKSVEGESKSANEEETGLKQEFVVRHAADENKAYSSLDFSNTRPSTEVPVAIGMMH